MRVEVVSDVSSQTLKNLLVRKVNRGSLVYTDMYRSYDGLVSYGFRHERINKSMSFLNGKVYINGIDGFWSYAKERLMKYHGVSVERFPYYLKELEFRYNHRKQNLFDLLLDALKIYQQKFFAAIINNHLNVFFLYIPLKAANNIPTNKKSNIYLYHLSPWPSFLLDEQQAPSSMYSTYLPLT